MIKNKNNLRPLSLKEYIGQEKIKNSLQIFINAALQRKEVIDHIIIHGNPGLGKTTIAQVIANELNTNIRYASGPAIEKIIDVITLFNSLEKGDILFIDEIHRIPKICEEAMYSAMEDFYIDIITGSNYEKDSIRINLLPFTLIGATTRLGLLSSPFRDRFGINFKLEYYSFEELTLIIKRTAKILKVKISNEAVWSIAKCSRGTPRIANKILNRMRDYAQILNNNYINIEVVDKLFKDLKISKLGLNEVDVKYMICIKDNFNNKAVGINQISKNIGEESETIIQTVEPFLMHQKFILITKQGRKLTSLGLSYLSCL